jgi:hypothetical protein
MYLDELKLRCRSLSESPLFWTLAVFSLALAARLLVFYGIQPLTMGADERFYNYTANRIREGRGNTSFIFMPGWPLVLSWFKSFLPSRLCPIIFGSVTPAVLYHLGRRTLGEKTGIIAGVLLAVFPDHVFFSQTLYAETALETLTVAVVCLAFWQPPWDGRPYRDALASACCGVLVLFKHFAVVPFGALFVSRAYPERAWLRRGLLAAAFLGPLVLHGGIEKLRGRDPFHVINSPMKSAGEWGPVDVRAAGFKPGVDRGARLFSLARYHLEHPLKNVNSTVRNFFRLWSPGTYAYRRSLSYFAYARRPAWFRWLHLPFYLSLLALGIFGLSFHEASLFRRYCVATIGLASSLSFFFLMMSRYRYPFMFPFFLYAADVLAKRHYYLASFVHPKKGRRMAFAIFCLVLVLLLMERLPHLTQYQ